MKREDLFITTKLWVVDWRKENVERAIRQCLSDLQTDYVDLYLIHWPVACNLPEEEEEKRQDGYFFDYNGAQPDEPGRRLGYQIENLKETWGAMEKLKESGLARSIGVSNFTSKKLKDLLSFCTIKPAMDQVELHPYLQQWELKEFCDEHGIFLTAYYPLGGSANATGKREEPLMKHPILQTIAAKYDKSTAQVMIRWAIQRGTVCIPKSSSPERIVENCDVFDFELTEEEIREIRAMDRHHRFCTGAFLLPAPLTWKDLWDEENVALFVCCSNRIIDVYRGLHRYDRGLGRFERLFRIGWLLYHNVSSTKQNRTDRADEHSGKAQHLQSSPLSVLTTITTGMANHVNAQCHFPAIFIIRHTATRIFTIAAQVWHPTAIAQTSAPYRSDSQSRRTSVLVA